MQLIYIYLLFSFLVLFLIAKISYKLNLVDLPNRRKAHVKPVVYTGGLGISLMLIISILFFEFSSLELNLIFSFSFLISLVGFIDDKYDLNVGSKICLQIIPIIYLFLNENLILDSIGDYGYFSLDLGAFSLPFSLISVLFLINAFNYFDGLDGTLSFSFITVIVIIYFLIPIQDIKLLVTLLLIQTILFLCFNFSILKLPKMFLGDSGSLMFGFITSFILIFIAKKDLVHPILLAWTISIYVYEFLSINLIRLKNKRYLFLPGKDHLHDIIFLKVKSIFFVNFFISGLNIFFFIIGYTSFHLFGPFPSLILYIFFFIIFIILRNNYYKS